MSGRDELIDHHLTEILAYLPNPAKNKARDPTKLYRRLHGQIVMEAKVVNTPELTPQVTADKPTRLTAAAQTHEIVK
jgi:hypothetical protein